jgi:hypothetical protein
MNCDFVRQAKIVLQENNPDIEDLVLSIEMHEIYVVAKIKFTICGKQKGIDLVGFNNFTLETFKKETLYDR